VIVFDTTYVIVLLEDKALSITDREDKPVTKVHERVRHLVQKLSESNSIICVPTPVLAEFMVRAGNAGPDLLKRLTNTSKFTLSPFGVKAAIEAAELIRTIKDEQKGQPIETWAKVKFDVQIVAIAKAEGCPVIYAEDPHMEALGKRVGIDIRRICDLPLPTEEEEEETLFSQLKDPPNSESGDTK
jgi:predicted nucleic acid-binding protein